MKSPPLLGTDSPPRLPAESNRKSNSLQQLLAILLSLCLGLFLADAFVSLLDDSLILFFNLHVLTGLRMIVGLFSLLTAVGVYGLIGLTPMVPKRLFLPIPFSHLAAMLALFPFAIYCYGRIQEVAVGICDVTIFI
jgi:hypothetical protein